MNVYEKLQNARVQLQKQELKKSGKNNYSGFDYFELSDFLPAVNTIFADLKLISVFKLKDAEAFLTVINSEKPDEIIEFSMPSASLELKGCNALQALGGVNTYCRRYLYFNALEIVEADTFDAKAGADKPAAKTKTQKSAAPVKQTADNAPDADIDIFSGAEACASAEELSKYYKENLKNVKNQAAFYKLFNRLKNSFARKEAEQIY